MRKLVSALALLALGVGLLGSTPAHATSAGSATFVCGVQAVIVGGGRQGNSGEWNSLSIPLTGGGTPVLGTATACPQTAADPESVTLTFDAADGADLNFSQHPQATLTIWYDDLGLVTDVDINAGGDNEDSVIAVGVVALGVGNVEFIAS